MRTGVKCNFSLPHHHFRKIVGKLSIRRGRMWNFTRIGPNTKSYGFRWFRRKGRLSIPAWYHPKKVWTATFLGRTSKSNTSLESSRIAKIECKISPGQDLRQKKLWLSIIPALRQSYQPRLGQPPKRCEPQLYLASLGQVIRCSKAVDLGSLNMQFQHDWPKDIKNYSSFHFLAWKLRKIVDPSRGAP